MDAKRLRRSALALMAGLIISATTYAAASGGPDGTVTYLLSLNDNGHGNYAHDQFAVYLSDSTAEGNGGIVSFQVCLGNATTLTNVSPMGTYDDGTGSGDTVQEGFTFFRTNTNPIDASQDTIDYFDGGAVRLVTGLGQTAGSLDAFAPAGSTGGSHKVQSVYGADLLVATGTYSDAAPVYFNHPVQAVGTTSYDAANVFNFSLPGDSSSALLVHETQTLSPALAFVPEPATGAVALLLMPGLLRRRRRK